MEDRAVTPSYTDLIALGVALGGPLGLALWAFATEVRERRNGPNNRH